MNGISYKCPNCSASINIDTQKGYCFCPYCGTKVFSEVGASTNGSNINITINSQLNGNADKSSEAENFTLRALSFERNGQFEEAEYYYNRALDADISSNAAQEGIRRVQSIITLDNIIIQRGKALSTGEGRVAVFLDGKKTGFIPPNSSIGIKAPVGKHTLQFKRGGVKSTLLDIIIESNKTVYEISVTTKTFKIQTEIKQYRRHEILH